MHVIKCIHVVCTLHTCSYMHVVRSYMYAPACIIIAPANTYNVCVHMHSPAILLLVKCSVYSQTTDPHPLCILVAMPSWSCWCALFRKKVIINWRKRRVIEGMDSKKARERKSSASEVQEPGSSSSEEVNTTCQTVWLHKL